MRTSLVSMVYVLCLSLVVGVLVLTAPLLEATVDPPLEVTVDIYPKTLNLNSSGLLITVYIEPPVGYDVEDINVPTVRLEIFQAVWDNVEGNKLMVKFDRQTVIGYIWDRIYHMRNVPLPGEGVEVTLTITGELINGTPFEGSDTIIVIYHG